MGGNIPGGSLMGGNFAGGGGGFFQGGVWWVGIFRVGIFPGGIFLEPYLTMFCFNYSKIEIRFHGIFKFSLTCCSFGSNEIDMNRDFVLVLHLSYRYKLEQIFWKFPKCFVIRASALYFYQPIFWCELTVKNQKSLQYVVKKIMYLVWKKELNVDTSLSNEWNLCQMIILNQIHRLEDCGEYAKILQGWKDCLQQCLFTTYCKNCLQ